MDPITIALIAKAVETGVKSVNSAVEANRAKKIGKKKIKEMKRQTYGNLLNEEMERSAESSRHGAKSGLKKSKSHARNQHDTSDLVRGALNI